MAFQFDGMEKFAAEKSFLEYLNGYPAQPEWLTAMICGIEQEEQDPLELKRVRQQKDLRNVLKGSLSTRVFETRTATGRENSVCQDSGVSQIFKLIIHNRGRRVIRKSSSLPRLKIARA